MENKDCILYNDEEPGKLKELLKQYIFNIEYPNELVRGIQNVSKDTLSGLISSNKPHYQIDCSIPYLVRDRFIEGNCISLMQLVSNWCNGFMILEMHYHDPQQAPEGYFLRFTKKAEIHGTHDIISEITNQIWGGIKSRFISEHLKSNVNDVQVPIVINHQHRHISFGTIIPQLSYRYLVRNIKNDKCFLDLSQKFVFHLNWSPEFFDSQAIMFNEAVQCGEIELF